MCTCDFFMKEKSIDTGENVVYIGQAGIIRCGYKK